VVVAAVVVAAGTAAVAADAVDPGLSPGRSPMTASALPGPLLLAALLLLAPITRALPADPPASAPPPPLVGSSVAAVLAQRGVLDLSADQVKQLEQVQLQLTRDQQAAREELSHPPPAQAGKPGSGPPGGGMAGGKPRPTPHLAASGPSQAQAIEQRLDELDTAAFLKAVELLPESRREQAIDIASRFREQLFETRERGKQR
jgi:hypothetical protein